MHAERPDGTEVLVSGDYVKMVDRAQEERMKYPGTKATVHGQGETIKLKSGAKVKVTKQGLKLIDDEKRKQCNRKRNKAAKRTRQKARRK